MVDKFSFDIGASEFVAVLGPNGSGKTTLLRTLAGIREPDAGCITLSGLDVRKYDALARARAIAYVASDDLFIDFLSVRDVVATGRFAHRRWWEWRAGPQDEAAITSALNAVGLTSFETRRFDTLSSGERQRVWLAVALAQEARVLILDEPTSHLDVCVAQEILQLLRGQTRHGKTVICALHDVNEAAQYADGVLLLDGSGIIAFDRAGAALSPSALQRAYGVPMEQVRLAAGAVRLFPVPRQPA